MPIRSLQALCLVSFFLADVRDGLGPFLGIFLTQRGWQPNDVGLVMTAGGRGLSPRCLPGSLRMPRATNVCCCWVAAR